jgi:hypothetical protein
MKTSALNGGSNFSASFTEVFEPFLALLLGFALMELVCLRCR